MAIHLTMTADQPGRSRFARPTPTTSTVSSTSACAGARSETMSSYDVTVDWADDSVLEA
ncbi:hypothetical protein ACIBL3_40305 [Kribbella sp. NPDC050124]|uniref:hypothetical protein n=1 Tax=Kribbella sp. NPDC050124 TaxID=3364114 RepID=UPI003795E883